MNPLDDIVMDKFDKVVKVVAIGVSLAIALAYVGSNVNAGVPQIQGAVNSFQEGKELLEVLSAKQEAFDEKDLVYGYVAYLTSLEPSEVASACSEEDLKALEEVAMGVEFETMTTEEELEKMKSKQYAIGRLGLDGYEVVYNIAKTIKDS